MATYVSLEAKLLLSLKISSKFLESFKGYYNQKCFIYLNLGFFTARFSIWRSKDKTKTEVTKVEYPTTVYEFYQLISQPTHLLLQSLHSIDLVFIDQPNLIVGSGAHLSLHSSCTIRLLIEDLISALDNCLRLNV